MRRGSMGWKRRATVWGLWMVLPLWVACGGTANEDATPSQANAPQEEPAPGSSEESAEGSGDGGREEQRAQIPKGPPVDGFKQYMPRGGIPALFDPQFVTADLAKVPDEAWVLGFRLERQSYAYDLNTLNYHEVVNHRIGDKPVAAVW